MQPTEHELFSSALAPRRQRGAGLPASVALHVTGVALLVALPAANVEFIGERGSVLIAPLRAPDVVELVAPPRRDPKPTTPAEANVPAAPTRFDMPVPPAAPAPKPRVVEARVPEIELPAPRPELPRTPRPDIPAPAPVIRTGLLELVLETAPRGDPPRLSVRAGFFSEIPLADEHLPRVRTQRLDSFGAVGLVAENNDPPRPSPTSAGAAFGRATLGRRRELVTNGAVNAGSNFEKAQASTALGKRAEIRGGGFSQVRAAKVDALPSEPNVPTPPITPVRILEKPRPAYTERARDLRIEGNVLLEVVFRASAEVEVLRVVRGLEEGLDGNAIRAAQNIHFEPARRNGVATDARALVTIQFQLAY